MTETPTVTPADKRVTMHSWGAYLALDNFDLVADRIERMVRRAPFTVIQWYADAPHSMDVGSHNHLDPQAYFGVGSGVYRKKRDDYASLTLACTNFLQGPSIGTDWETEAEARAYAHRTDEFRYDREDVTTVDFEGGTESGPGRKDKVRIAYTNQNDVTIHTVIIPEYVEAREEAEQQAALLDAAAANLIARPTASMAREFATGWQAAAGHLRGLADTARDSWRLLQADGTVAER